MIGRESCLKT